MQRKLSLALALACLAPPAWASAEWLDWRACVAEAQARNPQLLAARQGIEQSAALVDSSRGNFYPQISATASATRIATDQSSLSGRSAGLTAPALIAPPLTPTGEASPWSATNDLSMGISIKQSLVSSLKDRPLVSKREADLEGSRAAADKAAADLVLDLRTAFGNLLYAQQLIDLQTHVSERRRENVRLVELRFEGGRENKGALLKSRATYAQAQADLRAAQRALGVAQAQLARALGRPDVGDLRIRGDFVLPSVPPPINWATAAVRSPVVRQASAAVRSARFDVAVARSARYPDLAAVASATRGGEHWVPGDDRIAVGLTLSVPLYTGGRQTADIRAAAAALAKSEATLTATASEAATTLAQTYAALSDAVAKVSVQRQLLEAAQLQAEIARSQYSLGLATFQDWDLIENNLSEAERALLASRRDAVLAKAQWAKAEGTTLAEAKEP